MPGHAFGQTVSDIEGVVEPIGEEMDQCEAADADPVNVIGPVDQRSAPDHDHQDWKVDPVKPADR